jgi:NAD(P)-dependent dehydrogenase (short-subunit alcohol dehydrogenase family)
MSVEGPDAGSTVLVAGAAGSIGRETVACLAARGFGVVTVDHVAVPAPTAEIAVRVLTVDLLDEPAMDDALASLVALQPLRHVVVVAGGGDVEELTAADPPTESMSTFGRVVANNLHAAFAAIRHTVPHLRRGEGDRSITLVGSINAFGGYGAPGYSAAKAALSGLAAALAAPLGSDGIRINCLALGTVDTENHRRLARIGAAPADLRRLGERAPLHRILTAREAAVALASLACDFPGMTGATVVLDNGQTLLR